MEINYTTRGLPLRFVGLGNSAIDVPLDDLFFVKEEEKNGVYYGLFKIGTGISIEIPMGYNGMLKFRSGCGLRLRKYFYDYSCEPGFIDAVFRGEMAFYVTIVGGVSFDSSDAFLKVKEVLGDYPLQLKIEKVESPSFSIVESLSETWRGEGGFGSTGDSVNVSHDLVDIHFLYASYHDKLYELGYEPLAPSSLCVIQFLAKNGYISMSSINKKGINIPARIDSGCYFDDGNYGLYSEKWFSDTLNDHLSGRILDALWACSSGNLYYDFYELGGVYGDYLRGLGYSLPFSSAVINFLVDNGFIYKDKDCVIRYYASEKVPSGVYYYYNNDTDYNIKFSNDWFRSLICE